MDILESDERATDVKRSYDSPLRKAQAAATRRAIIDAAAQLFIDRGYVATSVDAIAEAAGVGRATVFTSVGGKKALLKTAYDVALVGDDDPIPFPLRPASLAVRADPIRSATSRVTLGLVTDIDCRAGADLRGSPRRASADPEVRDVFETIATERRIGGGNVVRDLLGKGARLRKGLDEEGAADIVWVLDRCRFVPPPRPSRGWTPERFQAWLAESIRRQILR